MAAQTHLGEVEIAIAPLALEEGKPGGSNVYPLPRLQIVGEPTQRKFRTVVLENRHLRAVLLPELGGRLFSIVDLATGAECLNPGQRLSVVPGGPRGVYVPEGLQWEFGETNRPTSMAEMDVQIVETEDGAARVILFELIPGRPLSAHVWLELPPDEACLTIEWRVLNRSAADDTAYSSGFFLGGTGRLAVADGEGFLWLAEEGSGLTLNAPTSDFDGHDQGSEGLRVHRRFSEGVLYPRQTDHARFSIAPVSGLGEPLAAASFGVLGREGSSAILRVSRPAKGRAFASFASGARYEAPFDAEPGAPSKFSYPAEETLQSLHFSSDDDDAELSWPSQPRLTLPYVSPVPSPSNVHLSRRDPRYRPGCLIEDAHGFLKAERWAEASDAVEDALLCNGDDPLAWWLSAAIARWQGIDDERASLANAHFLAPMEPMLRVEAFLALPATMSAEPHPLLSPLAESPDQLMEGASRLIEAYRYDDAARYLDEALRHLDLPLLRYLTAWNFERSGRMAAEAAIHIRKAAKASFGPPFPWRGPERRAVRELALRFPDDSMLSRFASLLD